MQPVKEMSEIKSRRAFVEVTYKGTKERKGKGREGKERKGGRKREKERGSLVNVGDAVVCTPFMTSLHHENSRIPHFGLSLFSATPAFYKSSVYILPPE